MRDTPTKKDWEKLVNRLALPKKWCRVWVMKTNGGDTVNYTKTVAANIRANMARSEHRIEDLARVINKQPATAGQKYKGTTRITVDELGAISEWLNTPVADFFTS